MNNIVINIIINNVKILNFASSLPLSFSFFLADQTLQYPFFFRPQTANNTMVQIEDGWTAFAPVSEWSILLATHADEWRISYLNRDYKVCNSYPSALIVPRQIDDKVIIDSSNFRDGGRFPVLCYRYEGGVRNGVVRSRIK